MDLMSVTLVVRWLIGWALMWQLPHIPDYSVIGSPKVSVLIPARNEEDTLPHLLSALRQQTFKPYEIIVVDDQSTDATTQIAQQAGVKVVRTAPLPSGWTGKNWALKTGYTHASGDIFVFLDADTEPSADLLRRLVGTVQHLGGLVSIQPYHRTEYLYEQLALLFNLVGLMAVKLGPAGGVAFGPAMATSKVDYEQVGGHDCVSGYVVEDWFIAHAYEQAKLPASAYIGHGQLDYRMYPGGLSDLIDGFNKNFATAAGQVSKIRMLAVLLWLSALFWTSWCLPAALLGWPIVGDSSLPYNLLLYIAFALQLAIIIRPVGSFRWMALLFPIPVVFFIGVFIMAIFKLKRGQIDWKGRIISTQWKA
ncbi:glycosyl transferase family 2 (plasmid) [Picosynechococcus sp. PCC 7003]|uniref:glycosyltransferase n=1 Tax=Picosynechococcus sp. PCC 7003 TaxID=374981 RepID=UPI00081041EF|nr:glycosyltransferase family 2 protein [Picosynechococcus sp. PCC 7003]ANV85944.1 glycosyl transferase family 2 [Picosynechococcus sp. PCC 7003]